MAVDIGGTFTDFVLADAGGYGNPAAIKRDLADGFISPENTMKNYGVDLD